MVKQSAVPSFSHLLTGTWSLSKRRYHGVRRLTYSLLATFDKAEMSFSNLNVAFLIWYHYTPSPCLPRGKNAMLEGLFLWVYISLAVGPTSCSPNENAKNTDQRPINCSPYSLSALWEQSSLAGLPVISAIDTDFKSIGQGFKTQ